MDKIKIFIAEDIDSQIELYTDAIDEFNDENTSVEIHHTIVKTKEEAIHQLNNNFFDAVFIDLNLTAESHTQNTAEGNELVDLIKEKMRYPVFVVTGKANEHIIEVSDGNEFIALHLKDEENLTDNLLKKVKAIYLTGITKVLGSQGYLNGYLHDIFWNHLSKTMDHWLNVECANCDIEKSISRYTLTHLYEYMEEASGNESIIYNPAEMYICPRIKSTIRPGDIVTKDTYQFLVLTPACTIAQQCEQFQLIKIVNLSNNDDIVKAKEKITTAVRKITEHHALALKDMKWDEKLVELMKTKEKNKGNLKGLIGNYISNTKGDRYHFLPKFLELKESLVDFQDITTVKNEDIAGYEGKMTVSVHFFKDIQSRFAAFYARQGSPDFDKKKLTSSFFDKILAV